MVLHKGFQLLHTQSIILEIRGLENLACMEHVGHMHGSTSQQGIMPFLSCEIDKKQVLPKKFDSLFYYSIPTKEHNLYSIVDQVYRRSAFYKVNELGCAFGLPADRKR